MRRLPSLMLFAVMALPAGCGTAPPAAPDTAAEPPRVMPFNTLGAEDAPVSIIEFTDLQCPYCARHARQTFPRLRSDYIATGKVRYASRDLPLDIHPYALAAAVASRCAGEQGRFWEYREALFAAQRTLSSEPYARIAGELGLDVERLEACRRDGRQEENVRADRAIARASGVRSTPGFVIGRVVDGQFQGEVLTGAQPYEVFAAKIDALLDAAGR
jgi:protein-disulfide isomerase